MSDEPQTAMERIAEMERRMDLVVAALHEINDALTALARGARL